MKSPSAATGLSEMTASAVSQFDAEARHRNGLYTANIFFHTKKMMIMFTRQPKEDILSFLESSKCSTFANEPT